MQTTHATHHGASMPTDLDGGALERVGSHQNDGHVDASPAPAASTRVSPRVDARLAQLARAPTPERKTDTAFSAKPGPVRADNPTGTTSTQLCFIQNGMPPRYLTGTLLQHGTVLMARAPTPDGGQRITRFSQVTASDGSRLFMPGLAGGAGWYSTQGGQPYYFDEAAAADAQYFHGDAWQSAPPQDLHTGASAAAGSASASEFQALPFDTCATNGNIYVIACSALGPFDLFDVHTHESVGNFWVSATESGRTISFPSIENDSDIPGAVDLAIWHLARHTSMPKMTIECVLNSELLRKLTSKYEMTCNDGLNCTGNTQAMRAVAERSLLRNGWRLN